MNTDPHPAQSNTIRNEVRDFPEWHLGRQRYALWAIELDLPEVRQRVSKAQQHLADLLIGGYCRQPHITLAVCGFPSAAPRHPDDFGAPTLQAQCAALRAAQAAPFELDVGALSTFTSAPYLDVTETQSGLTVLRQCLAGRAPSDMGAQYVPHVTVGLYANAWPLAQVLARLQRLDCGGALRLPISAIHLMSYAANAIGERLTTCATYRLDSNTFRWEPGHEAAFWS